MKAAFKERYYDHVCEKCEGEFKSQSSRSKWCTDCKR